MGTQLTKQQAQVLENQGVLIQFDTALVGPKRMTYYSINKDNGDVVEHNLPADPYSLEHYLAKGFTLTRPEKAQAGQDIGVQCPTCEKVCASEFGLKSHMKSHK